MDINSPDATPPSSLDEAAELLRARKKATDSGDKLAIEETTSAIFSLVERLASESGPLHPSAHMRQIAREFESLGKWSEAQDCYASAIELAEGDPFETYKSHDCLGALYRLLRQYKKAIEQTVLALSYARTVSPLYVLIMLQRKAHFEIEMRDPAALQTIKQAINMCDSSVPELVGAASTLLLAFYFKENAMLDEAEACHYKAGLVLSGYSERRGPAGIERTMAYSNEVASHIFEAKGEIEQAIKGQQHAIEIYSRLLTNPQVERIFVMWLMSKALHRLGNLHLAGGNSNEANEAFEEAESIREAIGLDTG